jgi:hypothetical protein
MKSDQKSEKNFEKSQILVLQKRLADEVTKNIKLEIEKERYKSQLASLKSSNSWRITSFARALRRKLFF